MAVESTAFLGLVHLEHAGGVSANRKGQEEEARLLGEAEAAGEFGSGVSVWGATRASGIGQRLDGPTRVMV